MNREAPLSNRILVAVDFGELTARTIDYAVRLAGADTQIDLLHVLVGRPSASVGLPSARELVDALIEQERTFAQKKLAELQAALPEANRGELILEEGPAADVICEAAEKGGHELIAVSTHGRSGLKHMLIGSVAERVVRLAKAPVVVVR
ncbi:MAG: universal stress protein [Deltaproteobacteria bacterium]|nr:MAG: universal stress protein [Deltaproteobacteria bacterium]